MRYLFSIDANRTPACRHCSLAYTFRRAYGAGTRCHRWRCFCAQGAARTRHGYARQRGARIIATGDRENVRSHQQRFVVASGRPLGLSLECPQAALMNVNTENWPRPHRLTVAEYYRMSEVGLLSPDDRVELIEGEIVEMPPIGSRHAAAVDLLAEKLIVAARGFAHVRVQGPIRLGLRSEPQPDLALLKLRADRYAGSHPGPADVLLVVEVSESTLRFDREVKSRLYARHGIPEYWVIDLLDDRVHVYRKAGSEQYAEHRESSAGSLFLPSMAAEIDLSELFEALRSTAASPSSTGTT